MELATPYQVLRKDDTHVAILQKNPEKNPRDCFIMVCNVWWIMISAMISQL